MLEEKAPPSEDGNRAKVYVANPCDRDVYARISYAAMIPGGDMDQLTGKIAANDCRSVFQHAITGGQLIRRDHVRRTRRLEDSASVAGRADLRRRFGRARSRRR